MEPFTCDCQRLQTGPVAEEMIVFSSSSHVTRRLARLCVGAKPYTGGPGWRLSGGACQLAAQLSALADALKPGELAQVQVMPLIDQQPAYWDVMPLALRVTLSETAWFPESLGTLHMAFQPVFDLGSGAVFGHEALVRAQLGERLIGAGELLSAALAHGGLHLFDRLARQLAIHQGAALTEGGGHLLINFMPGVVYDPEVCLGSTFAAGLENGIDPARLIFEVVETEAFPDLEVLQKVLDRYRREGMRVALDDLGAGHSSLIYLESLRPDLVKLDKSLLLGLTLADPRAELVDALIRYAHQLGVQVVAEGLETGADLAVAVALGADLGQGHRLGHPMFERDLAAEAAAGQLIRIQAAHS
ncbi:EAL domain-containing protein [Deinococcus rubellus]|uniref:EAL domain-containing protein n=1 Tax=Deinococcus rubellus TaxID=1889240 RepID=A0ABY5YHR2_9DEIO|nr:EAL domain-containing protein [Deinococcus rubellus]UWX63338.1 EAL domain-containing protein [Deinococcus rubellus]